MHLQLRTKEKLRLTVFSSFSSGAAAGKLAPPWKKNCKYGFMVTIQNQP
jgi:hypothetical protein